MTQSSMIVDAPRAERFGLRSTIASYGRHRRAGGSRSSAPFGCEPGRTAGFRQFTYAQNVTLTFGDRDHAARIQKIEHMACLDALIVGGERHQVPLLLAICPTGGEILPAGLF